MNQTRNKAGYEGPPTGDVYVSIDGTKKTIPRGNYTGRQLKSLLGISPDQSLWWWESPNPEPLPPGWVGGDYDGPPISDDEQVTINGGESFHCV